MKTIDSVKTKTIDSVKTTTTCTASTITEELPATYKTQHVTSSPTTCAIVGYSTYEDRDDVRLASRYQIPSERLLRKSKRKKRK